MSGFQKNTANQKWLVFAFNRTDNSAKTGDAAQITAKIRQDYGSRTAITDTNPTELEDGFYEFDLTAAEVNGDVLDIFPESSTSNIQVVGIPGRVFTTPRGLTSDLLSLTSEMKRKSWQNPLVHGNWPLTESINEVADNFQDQSGWGNHATLNLNGGTATRDSLGRLVLSGGAYLDCGVDASLQATGTRVWADVTIADTVGAYEGAGSIVRSAVTPTTMWCAIRYSPNNLHSYDGAAGIRIFMSLDSGLTWDGFGAPGYIEVVNLPAIDHRGGNLYLYDNGGVETLIYICTKTPVSLFHTAMYTISIDGGANWSAPVDLSADYRGTYGKPIRLSDGKIAFAAWDRDGGPAQGNATYLWAASTDLSDWTEYQIHPDRGDETTLFPLKTEGAFQGRLGAFTRTNAPTAAYWFSYSDDDGETWSTAVEETQLPVSNGTPIAVVRTPRDTLLAVYTEVRSEGELSFYECYNETLPLQWHKVASALWGRSISAYADLLFLDDDTLYVVWITNRTTPNECSTWLSILNYPECELATENPWFTFAIGCQRAATDTFHALAAGDDASAANQWVLRVENNGNIKVFADGETIATTTTPLNDTNPHRVVLTGSDQALSIWVDGVLQERQQMRDQSSSALALLIGAYHDGIGGTLWEFDGVLDRPMYLQGKVWTPEEIQYDYNAWHQGTALGTVQDRLGDFAGGGGSAFGNTERLLGAQSQLIGAVLADLPGAPTKNVALNDFPFLMVLASDHVTEAIGLTITAQRSLDGAAFAATTNSVVEVGSGVYKIDLSAADMNGDTVCLKFSEATADTRIITIVTQAT